MIKNLYMVGPAECNTVRVEYTVRRV